MSDTDRKYEEWQKKGEVEVLTPEDVKELFSNSKGGIIYNTEYYSSKEGIIRANQMLGEGMTADMHPYPGGSPGNGKILVIVF